MLQASLWPVLVLLLPLVIPSVGSTSAQSNDTQSNNTQNNDSQSIGDIISDNVTDLVGNVTKNASSPFVNDTETSSPDAANIVVINEVELNPQGSDVGRQWIELYNPSGADVNISGFEIRTSFKSATIRLPSDAVIEANKTYVIELDRHTLSNTAESLVLANATGEIIDRTPSLVDRRNDERTWQRIPDGGNEWQFKTGTKGELNDPDSSRRNVTYSGAHGGSADVECLGSAGCAEGLVIRIVNGDTLYVRVNSTVYKVVLALVNAPSSTEEGFIESRSFTRSLCLGSNVLVDQDDKLLTTETSVIAVVYCASTNLNSELLDSGYATLNKDQCETSEFAGQRWARDHGC